MAGAWTLGDIHYPVALAFQWILSFLILGSARPDATRVAVALVLALNGFEVLNLLLGGPGSPFARSIPIVDGAIVITLVFLASRFPTPWGRGARPVWAWLAALALWVVLRGAYEATFEPALYLAWGLLLALALVGATALLALRLLPAALAMPPGPLRTQSLLVGAGLGAGLAYTSGTVLWAWWSSASGGFVAPMEWGTRVAPAATFFVLAAFARVLESGLRARRRDAGLVALAIAGGLALGLADPAVLLPSSGGTTSELVTQTVRPLLLAVAVLRYDLFGLPRRMRAVLLPASAALFLVSSFILVQLLFTGSALTASTIDPAGAVVALVLLATLAYVFRRDIEEIAAPASAEDVAQARARLERYRLALEGARRDPSADAGALRELRRRLGISRGEHAALESVLAGNLVIPTAALVGASPGTLVRDRYEIVRELGEGGQGRVHLARDLATGEEVVMKEVLKPWERDADARRAALEREAAASARVASSHLARVHGVVADPWQTYLVREFVPGRSLEELVKARGTLERAEALRIVDDVLAGLEALHAAGLLHLDVKPANVVERPDGRAVLIDQGSARQADLLAQPADATRTFTPEAETFSPRWAAPEQLRGEPLDARTDVYQAGLLLYHLLTGRLPVEGKTRVEVERAILDGLRPGWPEGTDTRIAELVEGATARDPSRRPAGVGELRRALDGSTRERGRTLEGEPPGPSPWGRKFFPAL